MGSVFSLSRARRGTGLLIVVLLCAGAVDARAGTISVTTTEDGPGGCSLREAVRSANADADIGGCDDTADDDVVRLRARTYLLTREGDDDDQALTGDVDVTSDLEIDGAGRGDTTVRGAGLRDRIFDVHGASTSAMFSGLTIENGRALDEMESGGGLASEDAELELQQVRLRDNRAQDNGGGMYVFDGSLSVTDSAFTDNEANDGGGIGLTGSSSTFSISDSAVTDNEADDDGAGIVASSGTVNLLSTRVNRNRADDTGGGVAGMGGSLKPQLNLTRSRVNRNVAELSGGGMAFWDASATLSRTTVRGNRVPADDDLGGGGIVASGVPSLIVLESTIAENETSADGGGLVMRAGGEFKFENSTISGNRAESHGGGLFSGDTSPSPTLEANATTIARNVADDDAAGGGSGGGFYRLSGATTVSNSIVAGNRDRGDGSAPDCAAAVTANYSLFGSNSSCSITGGGNIVGPPALLRPLDDYGGPTPTHGLRSGSPAIDSANPATPSTGPGTCPAEDQRGVSRPQGPRCDMGAFERRPPAP